MAGCLEGGFLNERCLSVRSEPPVSPTFTQEKGIKRLERRRKEENEVSGLHTLLEFKRRQMKATERSGFPTLLELCPIKAAVVLGSGWERQFAG